MSSLESKSSSSTLTLQVKTLKGANFAITVPTNYTVAELQAQIARERDVPIDQQRIIYKGKVLKSDQTLASYGLEDGDNLHLIVRTPQQQQAAQQAIAADQASMSDVHAPGGAQPGTNPQIQIFPAGENGMMIGSVDIQDHGTGMPDLNQIVNQVLNQMGVPGLGQSGSNPNAPTITFSTSPTIAFGGPMDMNGMMSSGGMMMGPGGMMSMGMGMPMMNATASTSTSSSASSSSSTSTSTSTSGTLPSFTSIPGFGGISHGGFASLNDLRLGMNQVADMITPSTSTTLTSIGRGVVDTPITTQTSNDVAAVFEQLHTLLSNITPRVADVVMSLRRQETVTGTARQQVTQQANDVGMALRRLSPMLHHVGRYGSGINLGTDPSHVTVVQAQPQVSVHVTSQPVITAVTSSQPFTTTTPFAFPTTATTSQMFGYSAPATGTTAVNTASTSSMTSTSTTTAPSTDTTTSQNTAGQQAPVNMQQIMAQVGPMVGPIVSQLFSGAAAAANNATANNTGGAPANPLAAIMQAVGPAVQQVASSIQQGGAQGGNPLMAMIQNVMGSLAQQGANQPATTSAGVTATSTTPATTTATATPTVTPAFTGSVTGSTSAPSATPASSSASTSTSTSSSTSSSSSASPIDANSFAQLMSGMMGVLGQQAQAQQGATSGTSSSTATAPATTSSTSTSAAPIATPVAAPIATPITSQPAANPLANLLSGMGSGGMSGIMGMMSQIMGNAQGGRTIGDIMQSMGAGQQMEEDQDDDDDMEDDEPRRRSPMEAIINRVITGLSMPDMMAMVSGNWAPLERQHATLREILLHDMMDDTDTPHARDSVAITLAMGFVNTLLNEQVLASVRDKMIPDKDLHTVSYPVVRQRCRELINIVIDTPISTSTTQGTPFATQLQSWSYLLVGSWMNVLAEGFTDGITSVDTVIKSAVQLKLSSISPEIGFMLPMVSGMLSSFILRAHQQYRANLISSDDGTGAQGWIQHVPENEQKHWISTIAMDEKVQAEQKETAIKEAQHLGITTARIQHPFSYSYSSGSAGAAKRRRLGGSTLREGEVQDEKESSSTTSSSTTSSASTLYSASDLEGADLGAGLSRALKSAIDTVNQQVIKEEQKNGRLNDEDVDERKKENEKKAQEVIADLPSSNIQQLYRSQLIQDIRKRVRTDPDYNPSKFPKTSEHIDKA